MNLQTLPLDGLTVIELSRTYAAGLAGRYLRGYGAEVTRVDLTGTWADATAELTADESLYLHTGKSTLDLRTDGWRRLLDQADLVLSDLQPRHLATLGIGRNWSAHHEGHPAQVIVSVTAFGLHGPYADYEHTNATAFALGGIMGLTGDADRSPLVTGGNHAYALAGLNAFAAGSAAILGRRRNGGRGQLVEISGQECASSMLEYYGPMTSYTGLPVTRLGNHTRATWGIFPCADGWCGVFALERQVPALFALLDDPELDDPRFRDPLQRVLPENEEELIVKLYVYLSDKTMNELRELSLRSRVPIGVAVTPAVLLTNVGLDGRGAFDNIDGVLAPGRPFPGLGWRSPGEPAPNPPNQTVVSEKATPGDKFRETPKLPLDGIRVLDLTMMWAGPYATLRLAEMGADVIKIESPSAWDNIRTLLPQPDETEPWNTSFYFNAYNRDKRSLTLDLAQPAGRDLLLRLVSQADILIENYRADVLDKLGLGVQALHAANPALVVISMAAFGKHGPASGYVGFGPVIELMSGLASLSGYDNGTGEGTGEPFKTGVSYGDPVAGNAAVAATCLALFAHERTGEGVHIDLAQQEVAMTLIGEEFAAANRDESPEHRGCRDRRFVPQGCYRCFGTDQWIVLSIRTDREWDALCATVPALADLAALTDSERRVRHDELDSALTTWLSMIDPQEAMTLLQSIGVPAGRVLDTTSVLNDPNHVEQGFWVDIPHPIMHPYRQQNVVWHLTSPPNAPRRHAPLFGEHNEEILRGMLGLDDAAVEALRATNIIADAPVNPGVG